MKQIPNSKVVLKKQSGKWDTRQSLCSILLPIFALGIFVGPLLADDKEDKKLTKQLSEIITECSKVKVGATRSELLKIFTEEGGLSTATRRTFVHRRCAYIKVDVEFTLTNPKQSVVDEQPTDKVNKISKPYLELSISD